MEENEDEPDDVRRATPVEEEITRGALDERSGKPTPSVQPARRRHHCEKNTEKKLKKSQNKEECCRAKLAKAARAPKTATVLVYEKECTLPKKKPIPRHCLTREEWIDILATPSRKCPPPCLRREVTRKIRPVSARVAELAQPPKNRLLNTLQDRAGTLPIELVDNLIQTIEGETCLTPEQAERMFRDKEIRGRKKCRKRKKRQSCKGDKWGKRDVSGDSSSASSLDKEAVNCQYLMAESFVKSILDWKCGVPREEFKDIAEVILKRLAHVLEYNPVGGEDRKSQQMRFLADIVASWIAGVLLDVAEAQRTELEEECERRRKEEEESEEESDDESTDEFEKEDDDDDDDGKKGGGGGGSPPRRGKDDKGKDGKDDDNDEDNDEKYGRPERREEDKNEKRVPKPETKDPAPDVTERPQEEEKEEEVDSQDEEAFYDARAGSRLSVAEKKTSAKSHEEIADSRDVTEEKSKDDSKDEWKDETIGGLTSQETGDAGKAGDPRDQLYPEAGKEPEKGEVITSSEKDAEEPAKNKEEAEAGRDAFKDEIIVSGDSDEAKEEKAKEVIQPESASTVVENEVMIVRGDNVEINENESQEIEESMVEATVDISESLAIDEEIIAEKTPVESVERAEAGKVDEGDKATGEIGGTDERAAGDRKDEKELLAEPTGTVEVAEIPEVMRQGFTGADAEVVGEKILADEPAAAPLDDSAGRIVVEGVEEEIKEAKTAKIVEKLSEEKEKDGRPKRKPSKIPSSIALVRRKKFRTDTPFLTFDKIFHTIYNAIEGSRENPGIDPMTNRLHRAVYEKCSSVVREDKAEPLPELTKDVLDVMSGKIALWLRDVLSQSELSFMNRHPAASVESIDVREWSKWMGYVSDTANTWSTWIRKTIKQTEAMRSGKVTRGDWLDWTKSVDEDALLWRRFYIQSCHQAHQNLTMIRDRRVVKTGTKNLVDGDFESEMEISDLGLEL